MILPARPGAHAVTTKARIQIVDSTEVIIVSVAMLYLVPGNTR